MKLNPQGSPPPSYKSEPLFGDQIVQISPQCLSDCNQVTGSLGMYFVTLGVGFPDRAQPFWEGISEQEMPSGHSSQPPATSYVGQPHLVNTIMRHLVTFQF